ncbi:MAG TPA: EamA family transporter RarD [Geobacteraceae bacterium]
MKKPANLRSEKFTKQSGYCPPTEAPLARPNSDTTRETRQGVAYGLAAYLLWGFFPLYFKGVAHVPPLEVLAHRCAWSLVTLVVFLAATGGWGRVRAALTQRRTLLTLCVTTLLIATNWFVFLYAVASDQVLQSSFGYFVNPLVSVLLGFLFLRERLRRLQVVSVVCAGAGVLVLALHHGAPPWIALVLAVTFALYGLLRKVVPVDALTGLSVETLLLFPAASGYLIYLGATGKGAFPSAAIKDDILLPLAGIVTAVPLLWFAASARRLRLATVGFMQYVTPTLHFLLAILAFGEPFSRTELASFACIWVGLALYSCDAVRTLRP